MAGPKASLPSVADSNFYLRLLTGDTPEQSSRAVAWLRSQPEASVLVLDTVLVEVLFLLESNRAYGIKRADFLPELLLLIRSLQWRVSPLTALALEHFAATKLDYVDCLLLAMRESGQVTAVATFDKGLQKALGQSVL